MSQFLWASNPSADLVGPQFAFSYEAIVNILAGIAVSSEGPNGERTTSKLTHVVIGWILFFKCY